MRKLARSDLEVMVSEKSKKNKLLYILKYLNEQTDEEHSATSTDIIGYLAEQGIKENRHTIPLDIKTLQNFGADIVCIKSTQNRYFIASRKFELPELKLLIDAVDSAKFITQKKSRELIQKLTQLTSIHYAGALKRHTYTINRIKHTNELIYYTIDMIHEAVNHKRQIEFQYYEYTPAKKKTLKHNGEIYRLSPYALVWNDDNYYVMGYSEKHKKISKFRVDRIVKLSVTEIKAVSQPEDFDVGEYVRTVFNMYDGDEKTVELTCNNDMMKIIVDKFGESVETNLLDSEHFKAVIHVSISPTFYGWLFTFAGKISILAPEDVKEEYLNLAKNIK
ncbi:MAG: WYL domain-containing protein [Eubacteriales bacterium]|nr:WYL domain-containing protein [Eubacteriales bacterium]